MAVAKAAAPVCGWTDCTKAPVAEIALDRGSTTCATCGNEKTDRAVFKLCDEHNQQYMDSGDVTLLLLSAKAAV